MVCRVPIPASESQVSKAGGGHNRFITNMVPQRTTRNRQENKGGSALNF